MSIGIYYRISPILHLFLNTCPLPYSLLWPPSMGRVTYSLFDTRLSHSCAHIGPWDVRKCTWSRGLQWACNFGLVLLYLCQQQRNMPGLAWQRMRDMWTRVEVPQLFRPNSARWQLDKPQTYEQARSRSAILSRQTPIRLEHMSNKHLLLYVPEVLWSFVRKHYCDNG